MRKFLLTNLLMSSFVMSLTTQAVAQSTPLPNDNEASTTEAATLPKIDFVFGEAPDDHAIGDVTSPLTMITYASVTCGHCGTWFSNEWPTIKEKLVDTGKLRFVLRELPTPPAVLSVTGFLMAECAADEDYFDVVQYQMENQKALFDAAKEGKGQEAYAKVGALAGLNNEEDINTCLGNKDMMAHLEASGARADAAKIQGVPAFFINGDAYKGEQDFATFISLIEGMIEKGQSTLPEIEEIDEHKGHDH